MNSIEVSDLSKHFIINNAHHVQPNALKDILSDTVKSWFTKTDTQEKKQSDKVLYKALNNVNFSTEPGDRLGVIGRNGAGKSTLLKILSRITAPTSGTIKINGRIASLLEVGTGFHRELTGRENIYLNGTILGMKRSEIKKQFDEIVAFSEIGDFLETPVKHYSSGMYIKLGFSIAAHLESEILIVDEVLAVGDMQFQKKCMSKMDELSKTGNRTILFVSHNIDAISALCNKGLLLHKGEVKLFSTIQEVVEKYMEDDYSSPLYVNDNTLTPLADFYFKTIQITHRNSEQPNRVFFHDPPICIRFNSFIKQPTTAALPSLFVKILDAKKRTLFACQQARIQPQLTLTIEPQMLVRGEYCIEAYLHYEHVSFFHHVQDVCHFAVVDNGSEFNQLGSIDYGSFFAKHSWD